MFCRLFESASPFVILFFKKNVYHSYLQNDLNKSDECTDLGIVNPKGRILPCVGKVATVVLNDSPPLSFTGIGRWMGFSAFRSLKAISSS